MQKYPLILVCLLSCIVLSACNSTPIVTTSATRFDNPEVSGEPLSVNVALIVGSRTELSIAQDPEKNVTEPSFPIISGNITAGKGLEISVSKDESATHFGVKYQFYGEHTEQSTDGNFSQAFTIGFERNGTSDNFDTPCSDLPSYSECSINSDSDVFEIINTGDSVSGHWELNTNIYDIAWVLGYKFTDRDIIYGGPFYQWGDLVGYSEIGNTSKSFNSDGYMVGTNLAIEHRFDFGMGLGAEVVFSKFNWGNDALTSSAFNFKIDWQF